MKENKQWNEEFYDFHFDLKVKGLMLDNIRQAAIDHFKIPNLHNYRARLSSLSKPNRYQGKYVKLQEFMKPYNRKNMPEINVNEVNVNEVNVLTENATEISKARNVVWSWNGEE